MVPTARRARCRPDKQVEESADSLVRGLDQVLAGTDLDRVKRTDATFWRSGTGVLPKVEGKVRRRLYKPGSTCPSTWTSPLASPPTAARRKTPWKASRSTGTPTAASRTCGGRSGHEKEPRRVRDRARPVVQAGPVANWVFVLKENGVEVYTDISEEGPAVWQVAIFSPWPELCRANLHGDHRRRRRPIAHVRAVVQVEQQVQAALPGISRRGPAARELQESGAGNTSTSAHTSATAAPSGNGHDQTPDGQTTPVVPSHHRPAPTAQELQCRPSISPERSAQATGATT